MKVAPSRSRKDATATVLCHSNETWGARPVTPAKENLARRTVLSRSLIQTHGLLSERLPCAIPVSRFIQRSIPR